MPDPDEATEANPQTERVDVDDPFEVPEEVEQAWDEDDVGEGEAPSG